MADMSQQEISEFLSEPHVAHLATVRPDRRPHLAPVVYFEENGKAFVMVPANVVKLRNVRRNPKVSLSIATDQRPYKYVVLEGQGRVTDDNLKWSSATLFALSVPNWAPTMPDSSLPQEDC